MTIELRKSARLAFRDRRIGQQSNTVKLSLSNPQKRLTITFGIKPERNIRRDLRFNGFRWSRKMRYWHSYLNVPQINRTKKFYKNVITLNKQ
ncbi:MAG: hypothetical protein ACK5M3_12890 [Dysgonomonas sp.]